MTHLLGGYRISIEEFLRGHTLSIYRRGIQCNYFHKKFLGRGVAFVVEEGVMGRLAGGGESAEA